MSMLELLWSPGYVSFFLSGYNDSNSQDLEKSACDLKKICHLKNGISQRLVWAPLLFNFFIFTSIFSLHNFLKVYLRRQSSIVTVYWKPKGL